ncbi:MAG: ComF family protein [Clostridiales bacterium]|nr:ComF family protein [Clostridiales bacterium]
MKKTTFRLKAWLSELIAPTECRCLNCGRELFDGLGFCDECKRSAILNDGKTCKRCGTSIEGAEDYCGNCAFDKIYFDKGYSAFVYDGAVRDAILRFKFGNCGNFARVFAKFLAAVAVKQGIEFDIVTFAPMSKKSLKQRGYNQAQLLAEYFCAILECSEKLCDAVAKVKETSRQELLSRAERKSNLVGAYRCTADVVGKRVLVIDDIKTTGATLNECAKVLKKAGASSVIGLTVASPREKFEYEVEDEG